MVVRRGDRVPSERRSGKGDDERQPVIAKPAARLRRYNLVKLGTLRKGNHLCVAHARRGRRKAL